MMHTREELEQIIQKMQTVSNVFYQGAIRTGCHPFIEFGASVRRIHRARPT